MEILRGTTEMEFVAAVAARLANELTAGRKVVWIISGASHIACPVDVMHLVHAAPLDRLVILQADERFNRTLPVASYWTNLKHIGFQPLSATAVPILRPGLDMRDMYEITSSYEHLMRGYLTDADVVIGQLNLALDGSIAGIRPHTLAANPGTQDIVSYVDDNIVNITITGRLLTKIRPVLYVRAVDKQGYLAIERLNDNKPVRDNPAQILKHLPEVYIYN
jgi:hypothetical protein